MPTSFPHRCWAEIDLPALTNNILEIKRHLPPGTRYISVVKANSYGIGSIRAVKAVATAGVDMFGVANVAEAAEVRQIDTATPILLLSATFPEEDDLLFEYNLTPTISSIEEVTRYQEAAGRNGRSLPVHLKFDTGMGRLGIWHECAEELLNAALSSPLLEVRGLYSHFASAGEDPEFTALQRKYFRQIIARRNLQQGHLWLHIDNSAGLPTLEPDGPFNAVRAGLLQLGIRSVPDDPNLARFAVSPVVSLQARLSVVKDLPRGASVSYGRTHVLRRDSRVAVITAGYADGILRACSNRGQVLIRGQRCPILGIVTMDEIVVDVTDLPEATCGDLVTFIGKQGGEEISIHDYSTACGTIPWEALCALSRRVSRVYR